jgi:hypothetical protein|tara:strand:+ start:6845 stop:7543 length:699 start_codon:yes stop_codon:yes gene_type:complete
MNLEQVYKQHNTFLKQNQENVTEIMVRSDGDNKFTITTKKIASRLLESKGLYSSTHFYPTFDTNCTLFPYKSSDFKNPLTENCKNLLETVGYESYEDLLVNGDITAWVRDPFERLLTAIIEETKDDYDLFTESEVALDYWLDEVVKKGYSINSFHCNEYHRLVYLISKSNTNSFNSIDVPKPVNHMEESTKNQISNNKWKDAMRESLLQGERLLKVENYLTSEYIFYKLLKK